MGYNGEKDVPEVIGNMGTGNHPLHYHLRKTEHCKGFIKLRWNFIDSLISHLTEEELASFALMVA